jgi:hypothetical protein
MHFKKRLQKKTANCKNDRKLRRRFGGWGAGYFALPVKVDFLLQNSPILRGVLSASSGISWGFLRSALQNGASIAIYEVVSRQSAGDRS